eukprot:3471264-Rhodomonas_salina.3
MDLEGRGSESLGTREVRVRLRPVHSGRLMLDSEAGVVTECGGGRCQSAPSESQAERRLPQCHHDPEADDSTDPSQAL